MKPAYGTHTNRIDKQLPLIINQSNVHCAHSEGTTTVGVCLCVGVSLYDKVFPKGLSQRYLLRYYASIVLQQVALVNDVRCT